jgi:hypothetical protein
MTASDFNVSAHSPEFVRGPLDGSAWNIPPTVEAVEMRCDRLICRYKRIDKDTFLYVRTLPPGPEAAP